MNARTRPVAPPELVIRPAAPADVDAVADIEAATFSSPWSRRSFLDLVDIPVVDFVVADAGDAIAGYAIAYGAGEQSELANLAVAERYRRGGVGRRLLEDVMARAAARGARAMFLEVRVSNRGAQELYARYGFLAISRRRGYYDKPVEDALVLRADLRAGSEVRMRR